MSPGSIGIALPWEKCLPLAAAGGFDAGDVPRDLPVSDELPFEENYRIHADRLGEIATVLANHGCRLGLEFVGPKTSRADKQYAFLHDLPGMMGLCNDVRPKAGLLLD